MLLWTNLPLSLSLKNKMAEQKIQNLEKSGNPYETGFSPIAISLQPKYFLLLLLIMLS